MKKIWVAAAIGILSFTVVVFVFIPSSIVITSSVVVGTTSEGFNTCLHNTQNWKKWWPAGSKLSGGDSLFEHGGVTYQLSGVFTDGGIIRVQCHGFSAKTRIQTISRGRDSIIAEWSIVVPSGANPFTRLSRYMNRRALRKSSREVFDSLCLFAGKTENIYGFHIERTTFTEIFLIATRFRTTSHPTIADIYSRVNSLREYIKSRGATEKYFPMMNTRQIDPLQYETMVAISIDKEIPVSGDYSVSRMVPMKDRFLTTRVQGGESSIKSAHNAIEKYMSHRSLSMPARPFDILVTERNKETDTTKWETLVFYPSM